MFVGETGIGRVVQRAAELTRRHGTEDVRRFGAIDLATVQRYLNFHFSVSLDLFGAELSSNAASYFSAGLKGRYEEAKLKDDHCLLDASYPVCTLEGDRFRELRQPALNALNERLRDDYIADCQRGVDRWNKVLRERGIARELRLPHRAFNRKIGAFAGQFVSPDGRVLGDAEWRGRRDDWLPSVADAAYVGSLMQPVREAGKMANWIAPPARGIDGKPLDFDYVRLDV